jgi:hypothetical protein
MVASMWSFVGGTFLAAAALLVLAGVPKLADPMPLVRALRSARLPASRALVRVLAAAEVAVGVAAVVRPGRVTAVAVAGSYVAFTAFVALTLRRGGVLGSCGCFGRPDTPPTHAHLAVTAVFALAAGSLAYAPGGVVWTALTPEVVALAGFAALVAWLAYLVMAVLPTATPAAVRSTGTRRSCCSLSSSPRASPSRCWRCSWSGCCAATR